MEEFEHTRQYFHAEFSQPFAVSGSLGPGDEKGLYVGFGAPEKPVEVRTGISFISEDQAAKNLQQETGGKSFPEIMNESRRIWTEALGKIRVRGGSDRQKRIFYTSLYRCYERMSIFEDRYFSA
jgi:putative alpha-1,2-mannosidase